MQRKIGTAAASGHVSVRLRVGRNVRQRQSRILRRPLLSFGRTQKRVHQPDRAASQSSRKARITQRMQNMVLAARAHSGSHRTPAGHRGQPHPSRHHRDRHGGDRPALESRRRAPFPVQRRGDRRTQRQHPVPGGSPRPRRARQGNGSRAPPWRNCTRAAASRSAMRSTKK